MNHRRSLLPFFLFACTGQLASAWLPQNKISKDFSIKSHNAELHNGPSFDPMNLSSPHSSLLEPSNQHSAGAVTAATLAAAALLSNPEPAAAAVAGAPNAVGSALASYGHILSVMGLVSCTMYERATIKPNMSPEDEDRVAIADTLLGVWGVILTYSGYLRVTQYEKGWDFYQHEPVFWIKIFLVGIYGACSFFNTTKIIQRSVAKRTGENVPPMSEALAARMNTICNAELTALAAIPLTASLMARGVGYNNDFPFLAGAIPSALVLFGLGFKYVKEALDFDDAAGVVSESE